jgi:hypothetical protein
MIPRPPSTSWYRRIGTSDAVTVMRDPVPVCILQHKAVPVVQTHRVEGYTIVTHFPQQIPYLLLVYLDTQHKEHS